MAILTWVALLQTVAIIYLLFRVNRLERAVSEKQTVRRPPPVDGQHKVIPLLKEQVPPGPFKGKPTPSSPDSKK